MRLPCPPTAATGFARRFAARAGAVDNQDGFEGFELLKPTDGRLHLAGGDQVAGRGGVPGVDRVARVRGTGASWPAAERAGGDAASRWASAASCGLTRSPADRPAEEPRAGTGWRRLARRYLVSRGWPRTAAAARS